MTSQYLGIPDHSTLISSWSEAPHSWVGCSKVRCRQLSGCVVSGMDGMKALWLRIRPWCSVWGWFHAGTVVGSAGRGFSTHLSMSPEAEGRGFAIQSSSQLMQRARAAVGLYGEEGVIWEQQRFWGGHMLVTHLIASVQLWNCINDQIPFGFALTISLGNCSLSREQAGITGWCVPYRASVQPPCSPGTPASLHLRGPPEAFGLTLTQSKLKAAGCSRQSRRMPGQCSWPWFWCRDQAWSCEKMNLNEAL